MLKPLNNHFRKYGWLYLAAGLAPWLELFFSIEWTFAYCHNPEDGPASAVFGLPFPYTRWNAVSSMEYAYMPHIYLINLLVISAIIYAALAWTAKLFLSKPYNLLGIVGAMLLILHGTLFTMLTKDRVLQPTFSIGDNYSAYFDLRPVQFTFTRASNRCTPSRYWFPDNWKPVNE